MYFLLFYKLSTSCFPPLYLESFQFNVSKLWPREHLSRFPLNLLTGNGMECMCTQFSGILIWGLQNQTSQNGTWECWLGASTWCSLAFCSHSRVCMENQCTELILLQKSVVLNLWCVCQNSEAAGKVLFNILLHLIEFILSYRCKVSRY